MDVLEISGKCQECGEPIKIVVTKESKKILCSACGEAAFKLTRFKGVIYIISNKHQSGVKIGLTEKSVEARLKSLSSTGVPGKFQLLAIFPSYRPKADEKKAHTKLKRFWIAKEHFAIDPADAIVKIRAALSQRQPIIYDEELKRQVEEITAENKKLINERLHRA